VKRMW